MRYVAVTLGGFIGALLRYALTFWNVGMVPYGTLAANLAGSFLLGSLLTAAASRWKISPIWHDGIGTGVIGSFTTFSTFDVEVLRFISVGGSTGWLWAVAYVLVSLIGGVSFAWMGIMFVLKTSSGRKT